MSQYDLVCQPRNLLLQELVDEALLLHPYQHPTYEGPVMDSVLVGDQEVGVACQALEVGACVEEEEHHKMALEEV